MIGAMRMRSVADHKVMLNFKRLSGLDQAAVKFGLKVAPLRRSDSVLDAKFEEEEGFIRFIPSRTDI